MALKYSSDYFYCLLQPACKIKTKAFERNGWSTLCATLQLWRCKLFSDKSCNSGNMSGVAEATVVG